MPIAPERMESLPVWEPIKKRRWPREVDPEFHCNKKAYESQAAGKWAARKLRESGSKVTLYRCRVCKQLHLGNT